MSWRSAARSRAFRHLVIEAMEARTMLSTITWAVDSSGDWNNPANWIDDRGVSRIPGAGDDVIINRPSAAPTVTFSAGSVSIHSLMTRDPFILDGGTLSVTGTLHSEDAFTLNGGTLAGVTVDALTNLTAGSHLSPGSQSLQGATLDGVTLDGNLGFVNDSSTLTVVDGLTVNGVVSLAGRLVLNGTQTLAGNGSIQFPSGPGGGVIDDQPGATGQTLTIAPGITVKGGEGGFLLTRGGTNLVNQGTIEAETPGGQGLYIQCNSLENDGTIRSSGGDIQIYASSVTDKGVIEARLSSTLTVHSDLTVVGQGSLAEDPGATISMFSLAGDTNNASAFQPKGTVQVGLANSSLEAMSQDLGDSAAGFENNFAYGTLTLVASPFHGVDVRLVDDARNSPGTGPEALYVDSLVVPAGDTLDLNGLHLYARTETIDGSVVNGTVSTLPSGGTLAQNVPSSGTISTTNRSADWSVYGHAGQALTVVVHTGAGGTPSPAAPGLDYAEVELLDPAGHVLASGTNSQAGADVTLAGVPLSSDGVYQVHIGVPSSHAGATGNYLVAAYDTTRHSQAIGLDQDIHGQLADPYREDQWTFSAQAGAHVGFDLLAADPSLRFSLTGPGGTSVFSGQATSSDPVALPASGTYTLTVGGGGTGAYGFRLHLADQPDLTLGTPYQGGLSGNGETQVFRVSVPRIESLLFTLQDRSAADHNELYVKFGAPPTLSDYQYRSTQPATADQQVAVSSAAPGTWYVLVYGNSIPSPSNYTLTVSASGVVATGVSPVRGGDGADTPLTLTGGGFAAGTTVALVAADGTSYPLADPTVESPSQMTATVKAHTVPGGTYTVRVTGADGSTATLADAFREVPGGQGVLTTNLVVPNPIGYHVASTIYVEYRNTGNAAMPAPLLVLTAFQNGKAGALLTLDPSRQVSGFWTSATPEGYSQSVQILASGATPGWLEPGEDVTVPVYYAGWLRDQWDFSRPPVNFTLGSVGPDNRSPLDWNAIGGASAPPGVDPRAWSVVFGNLVAAIGPTVGDFVSRLDAEAGYLGALGDDVNDESVLFGAMLQQAVGPSPFPQLGNTQDAGMVTPGLSLTFDRSFSPSILSRSVPGPFGLGWIDSWETSLTARPDGTVTITPAGGGVLQFQPDSRQAGSFFDPSGESGTLARLAGGGYTLKEPNGFTTAFNPNGTLNYVEDTNGNRITAGYDGSLLSSLTHSSGQSLHLSYNAAGRIISVTDSVGRATTYTYDASNEHLLSATSFDGKTITYAYGDANDPARANALVAITLPDATHDFFAYDDQGRLADFHLDARASNTTFTYGPGGEVDATNADGATTRSYFDARGLLAKVTDPEGGNAHFSYSADGSVASVINPAGLTFNTGSSAPGSSRTLTDPLGQTLSFANAAPNDRVSSFVDSDGNPVSFSYDSKGNLATTTYADGTVERLAYDPVGDVISTTSRDGQTTILTRNAAGQVLTESLSDHTSASFTYDPHGNLTSATNSDGTTTLTYDAKDRLTRITYPKGRYLDYTYDAAGRRTRMVDQGGFTVNYAYDAAGRLSGLTDGSGALVVSYTYDPAGQLIGQTNGNGTSSKFTYDLNGNLQAVANYAPGGALNSRFTYTYNDLGQRIGEATLDGAWSYSYDADGRLTHAVFTPVNSSALPQDIAYSYDAAGNLTSTVLNGESTQYTSNSLNEYTQVGDDTLKYDKNGRLSSSTDASGTTTFAYDALGHLISESTPAGGTWTFTYDALGQRVSTTHAGQQVDDVIDPLVKDSVVGEYDGSGKLIANDTFGLGLTSRVDASGAAFYYAFDGTGNTSELTGSTGAPADRYAYDPFGNVLSQSGSVLNPFQFVGEAGVRADGGPTLDMGTRAYMPSLGRFTAPDTIGLAGGPNLYAYAGNSPTNAVDPLGTALTLVAGAFIGATVGAAINGGAYLIETWAIDEPFNGSEFAGTVVSGAITGGYIGATVGSGSTLVSAVVGGASSAIGTIIANGGTENLDLGALLINTAVGAATTAFIPLDVNGTILPSGSGYGRLIQTASEAYGKGNALTPLAYAGLNALNSYLGAAASTLADIIERVVNSQDPNAKSGPAGFEPGSYIGPHGLLPYRIDFENDPKATAPAQRVRITDQLDPNLDWGTLQLTEVAFGDTIIPVPADSQHFSTTVPVTENGKTFQVAIDVALQPDSGQLVATLQSIDPKTQLPPDVLTGFLPPENGTGQGMGHLSYTVRARAGLPTGTTIHNVALITFDANAPISTDQVNDEDPTKGIDPTKADLNTIDAGPPSSAVAPLPTVESTPTFLVSWSGSDDAGGSGIASFDVYVSEDGGAFAPFQLGTPATSATFSGAPGHSYAFYSVATDHVGNRQQTPVAGQASTTVVVASAAAPAAPPMITLSPAPPLTAGSELRITGSFTSTASGPFAGAVDYGDGGGLQPLTLTPDRTFALDHVYTRPGTYSVTVFIVGPNGVASRQSEEVSVNALSSGFGAAADAFVATLYRDELGRRADPAGLHFWSGAVSAGVHPRAVALAIWGSRERRSLVRSGVAPKISLSRSLKDALGAARMAGAIGAANPGILARRIGPAISRVTPR